MVQIKLKYKDYLLKLDNLFPFFFLLLRYFNINYYLALNYRYRFNRFYEKSRKVYGGMAINETIKLRDSKKKIYEDDDDVPDWDFYSPEPVKDALELMLELDKLGYKAIQVKEAMHPNTYKLKLENFDGELADISYIWNNYYYKIPTIEIKGIHYVAPSHQIMDMYRAFVNPMLGWFKIEKYYQRASLLEELYLKVHKLPDYKKNFNEKQTNQKMI